MKGLYERIKEWLKWLFSNEDHSQDKETEHDIKTLHLRVLNDDDD